MSNKHVICALLVVLSLVSAEKVRDSWFENHGSSLPFQGHFSSHDGSCPNCVLHRQAAEASLSQSELANSRIEFLKQQILKKLRLKEPPIVEKRNKVPLHALHTTPIQSQEEFEEEVDDFYGKTGRILVFPVNEMSDCSSFPPINISSTGSRTDCSTYQLPDQLLDEQIISAVLWTPIASNEADISDFNAESLALSIDSHPSRKLPSFLQNNSRKDGWVQFDMLPHVRQWVKQNDMRHQVVISCPNCDQDIEIADDPDSRPFFVISIDPMTRVRRLKRNVSCAPGVKECCRESLYLSFKEIGWDDWIVQPKGYQAYFCKGSCSEAASVTVSGSHYTTIVQKLIHSAPRTQQLGLVPCCTATKLSSMALLYMDKGSVMTEKIIPNMIVEACGCM